MSPPGFGVNGFKCLCVLIFLPACFSCTNFTTNRDFPLVGPPAMVACLSDERIMPQYRAYQGAFKRLVAGVKENSRTVSCYWGSVSPLSQSTAGDG
jgi:hypothetical protein